MYKFKINLFKKLKFISSRLFYVFIGMFFVIGIYIAQAQLNLPYTGGDPELSGYQVTSGTTFTHELWNGLMNRIAGMGSNLTYWSSATYSAAWNAPAVDSTEDLGSHVFCSVGYVLHDGGNGGWCNVYFDGGSGTWKLHWGKWMAGGINCRASCLD